MWAVRQTRNVSAVPSTLPVACSPTCCLLGTFPCLPWCPLTPQEQEWDTGSECSLPYRPLPSFRQPHFLPLIHYLFPFPELALEFQRA